MICPACKFPILTEVELAVGPDGVRQLGRVCTHCERAAVLVETVVRPPKYSPQELRDRSNQNDRGGHRM